MHSSDSASLAAGILVDCILAEYTSAVVPSVVVSLAEYTLAGYIPAEYTLAVASLAADILADYIPVADTSADCTFAVGWYNRQDFAYLDSDQSPGSCTLRRICLR